MVFARAGFDVVLYDQARGSMDAAIALVRQHDGNAAKLVRAARSLEEAVTGARYVQENCPEDLKIKRPLYVQMGEYTSDDTILASSTSGFPASALVSDPSISHRCIVAHPINPPHLIPLVEIVPSPRTHSAIVTATQRLMLRTGQVPILLQREIDGFVANRLQSAILAEAFKLVEDGVASVEDIDLALTEGLAPRWFFIGPFETIDLNAQGGITDYCRKLGPMYYRLAQQQAEARTWSRDLVADVEAQRRTKIRSDELEQRRQWRDRCLARMIAAKREIFELESYNVPRSADEAKVRPTTFKAGDT